VKTRALEIEIVRERLLAWMIQLLVRLPSRSQYSPRTFKTTMTMTTAPIT
jgi:hypothetical protein